MPQDNSDTERYVWHLKRAEHHLRGALKLLSDQEGVYRGSEGLDTLKRAQNAITGLHNKEKRRMNGRDK